MATVTHVTDAEGYHHLGIKDGKAFIPFVSMPASHYDSLKESAEQAKANGDDDDKGGGE